MGLGSVCHARSKAASPCSWGCCFVALAGSQAPLHVCRVQAFLQATLFPGLSLKLSFAFSGFM